MKYEVLRATLFAVIFMFGMSCMALYYASEKWALAEKNLKTAQADARAGWGKAHDLQEGVDNEEQKESGLLRVKLWEAEQKLRECK